MNRNSQLLYYPEGNTFPTTVDANGERTLPGFYIEKDAEELTVKLHRETVLQSHIQESFDIIIMFLFD
jgi:hypothetical protein